MSKGRKGSPHVPLEDFHDDYWSPLRLIMLGAVTLGTALVVIWLASELAAGG